LGEGDAVMHVLIVEHEPEAETFARHLKTHGIACTTVSDIEAAWRILWDQPVPTDIIVLDVLLSGDAENGLRWAHDVRAAGFRQPILVLTQRTDVDLNVKALEDGDDVLTLPCALPELEAHLKALHRRGDIHPRTVDWRDLTISVGSHAVYRGGQFVRLTAKEHELVELLVVNPGRVFSRSEILERLWGNGFETHSNLIDVYVKNLRSKLGPGLIETVRGLGYRFPG
jgi:two-component system, OmpR family, response regulator QseB